MSQFQQPPFPRPPGPIGYYPGSVRPPRPASITTLAILGIIVGSFLSVCMALMIPILLARPIPAFEILRNDSPSAYGVMMAETFLRPIVGIVPLASSIGALFLKPWARIGMLAFAATIICINIADIVLTVGWMDPVMQRIQPQVRSTPYGAGVHVGQYIGWLLWTAFAVLLLIFFNRPREKAAFSGSLSYQPYANSLHLPAPPFPPIRKGDWHGKFFRHLLQFAPARLDSATRDRNVPTTGFGSLAVSLGPTTAYAKWKS